MSRLLQWLPQPVGSGATGFENSLPSSSRMPCIAVAALMNCLKGFLPSSCRRCPTAQDLKTAALRLGLLQWRSRSWGAGWRWAWAMGALSAVAEGAFAQGYAPEQAVRAMTLAPGLEVRLVASEPTIAQPVCIEFDPRGRLWCLQYLQYPNPAGLRRAAVDRWSRTRYDQIPEPPPRGPRGADRVTILEDTNGHGAVDRAHDFLSGLNLATGLAFGHGGVFVLNVPYLLFYPDRNRDDVPDTDPVVCLTGFGMEDAHSVANSLTWGPDGWLYGCQGSTVTSRVRGYEFQQGVWRYHPLTREFELFCEGGGNSWGLDFDDEGELLFSTNVGPYRHLHGVPGAYYWKSFGKHGALHNPYAFGFFDHIPHTNFTGGHVTDGGLVYAGTNLPAPYRGTYVCGDLLGHGVQWHPLYRHGTTFTSAHGGYLLAANDRWFAPTDLALAPDGALYVADWCDRRTAHPDPDADWDRSNGRIYRIAAAGTAPWNPPDLESFATPRLLEWLDHPNPWIARRVQRVLADRRDPEAILPLRSRVFEAAGEREALRALWGLHVSGGFHEAFGQRALQHPVAAVRKWSVRLLGEWSRLSPESARALTRVAATDPDARVRSQLASTAQRLPPAQAWPIIETLLRRDADAADPFVPLLVWWALERHAVAARDLVVEFFAQPRAWEGRLVREVVGERLVRRWTAEGSPETYDAVARVLNALSEAPLRRRLLAAVEQGLHDRVRPSVTVPGSGALFAGAAPLEEHEPGAPISFGSLPPALRASLVSLWRSDTQDPLEIRLAVRAEHGPALKRLRELAADSTTPATVRADLIRLWGEVGRPEEFSAWPTWWNGSTDPVNEALWDVFRRVRVPDLAPALLRQYSGLTPAIRARVRQLLLSRPDWTRAILSAVDTGQVPAGDFALGELRAVAAHEDRELDASVRRHWGRISGGTAEERLAEMRRHNNDLNAGTGRAAAGQAVFEQRCAVCHRLGGLGGSIGPDLTHANRSDREFLLASLVDPDASIRKEFLAYDVELADGRHLSGVMVERSATRIVLGLSSGERLEVPADQVRSVEEAAHSLMPEGLLRDLAPADLRDLFSFLQTAQK